ncbi:hypothetical protein U1Q18_005085 [Sarracenia purpurea var. burkii]
MEREDGTTTEGESRLPEYHRNLNVIGDAREECSLKPSPLERQHGLGFTRWDGAAPRGLVIGEQCSMEDDEWLPLAKHGIALGPIT